MNNKPYRVTVVVDPGFGAQLLDLPSGEPAWVVDSAENHPPIEAIWRERKAGHLEGITAFKFNASASREDWLVSELDAIELHRGEFSHTPPWSVLNVVGVPWSDRIMQELAGFGFTEHVDTPYGFEAKRK
jgi:hypothetical protein